MDIFKGIGDFFGGLFGQKKKREDEQQPQQQQSAVSFNSTPKLGDNFANNLSNPTQPQQPKEFAKSSVDLNPVKPVQPVQPQMNREQERQQLTDKYRQEETDRYNQGSDHVANFLNDIFSGGKTAQMRENTINQNIQNRVNAEMLRKYGPDDQQVKQNIAQTSQNINKNATAVSDFTKNYNNNLQQTVVAPVSAVKGAANSVVETVPKVSGAITELGANTIKLFDEDNQFANNLIKRVRADREKNIVRKTLNDTTGLTDQDNKMAYGLGSSGARMAIDASMTPVTGGVAPAVVHGVEAHSEMMDHLDNIEARKRAEAAAKGETYTPSSFTSRYLASTANAGAQAAIEKLGIDNLTGKIGGKFAKNMVGRAITGALGEAGEEGAQQYAENFTKKLFDNKQDIHENVAESALMGGIMGGAGKMAFGGMESVKNPYNTNNGKFNSYDPKALIEAERNAVRTGLFNKNNANSDLSLVDKEFNVGAPERLAKALRNGADGDISFMRMPNRLLGEVNAIRKEKGLSNINNNTVVAYKNAINNHLAKRIGEGMSPESSAHIAADSIINPYSNVYAGTKSKNGYNRDHIHLVAAPNGDKYNSSTVSEFNGGLSLKNIAPRDISEIKKSQAMLGAPLVGHKPEDIGISSGLGDIAAPQGVHTNNIAQNTQKVNNGYRYSDEIRNKIAQDLDERLLRVRDNTGETLADFETRLKQEGATEQEIEPYKNSFIRRAKMFLEEPRSMPGWSLDQENKQNNETNLADFNFQPSAINENTKLYHGTNGKVAEEIRKNGFKRGNELDENAYFGGGHDVSDQDSVSFSTNRNVSENFAINGRDNGKGSGALIEARLLPDARVVETDAEIYAEDLNEVTEQLRKQGVDAVFLKNNGEDELVVLNPEKVDRNILIERYKLANQQKQALTAKLEDLKARHQNLTGDEDLVFNIFKDELQKNALGYFDPKTNQINLNDLTFETLNHEIGHKIFSRVPLEQKADLIDEVRKTFGDEALIQQYSKDYGNDLNLLAEEKLADGFSDYYQGRLNGEESTRLGAKLGIPPKILAYYDRMIEAIKSVFGATNELKKFYAEIETGKFTQDYKQNAPVYNENPVYKVAQDSKGDLAETDQKTRKFAETVLGTDTPPKDFVKLMHAGDESLKYTPKKNSELWNEAAKSVQESPERVFNELENTRVANDETMAKGIALAKHYQAMGDDLKASELYVELAKKATEAGRTVQALNLMRRTTPEGVLMSTMREVESYNDKMKSKPNKQINITPEQRAEFLGKLREAYAMPEGDLKEIRARRIAIGEAIREVRDQIPSSKWDKFTTLWKAGLLTAPTTHIRNIAGNIINGGSEKVAQTVGSAFDWMISKGTGKRTLTRNGFSGMLKGIKEGSGYAKDIMRTGIDTTGEIDSKWRDQRTNYGNSLGGKLAQGYTDFVFNSLNASDKIFRGSAEKMSITNQAKAIAINEKLRGVERKARIEQLINNPTNAMLENAKHDADMATFQQDTGLGQFVAKGRQAGGITKKATDIIMPFTGVPSAVADQLVNYSPLGVAKGVKQVADLRKAVKNGLDDSTITALQRKASTQLGRGITGTMLLGAGLALANAGLLSGQPRDDNEKRQWVAEGKKANALKIGDTWVPIDTLSPQMILAAAGANAQSRIENGQNILSTGLNTLSDGVKSWTEQGYMTGVKDAINTLTGDKDFNKYAIQQTTSLIPNGIRKVAAAMDDKARQADYGNLGESIQNSIPLWRNGLPAKYDIYGREIKTNPFSTLFDPQKSSAENPTDLSKKINEFRKNNPELDSVIPKTAPNKIAINGQTRELTSSERSEYQRLLGENISKYMMSGGFNDSSFNKLSEGDKKDMLEKIQSDVKKSVEMALFNKTSKQTNDNAKKIAQNIVNGGNNELKPEWKTKEQSKDELYKNPELEYERLQAEYDKKKKNGDFDGRKVQELQERMKVRRAQVGKDTPKSYRDMYSSGKQSFNMLLKEMDSDQERNEAMTKVLEYGDKLVAAGLEKKNKFRDKYGNVDFEDSKDKKGRGRGKKGGISASSVNTADITSTLSKNLLKTRGSQAKALNAMPTISVRNSSLQARVKRSAVRFKK